MWEEGAARPGKSPAFATPFGGECQDNLSHMLQRKSGEVQWKKRGVAAASGKRARARRHSGAACDFSAKASGRDRPERGGRG